MTNAFFGEPRTPRLFKLLQEIQRGEILVPRLMRSFVWTDGQRLALVDSVYSGYPIGVLIVWRTQEHRLATYDHLGPLRLPPDTDPGAMRQYLLDGHQRMATLFGALGAGLYAGEASEVPAWIDEDSEETGRWPIYFDLEAESQPIRLLPRRREPPASWLPLDIVFDPYALRGFESILRAQGQDRKIVNRVQFIAETFRDYIIPVMPVATEDLKQVTESFTRTNSGGSRVSEVHMLNALMYSTKFDLLEELDDLATELKPVGWEQFDQQMIVDLCKARLGFSRGDAIELFAERVKDPREVLRGVKDDIVRAARVLDTIAGVRGPGSLPYGYQAVLLADALHGIDKPSKKLLVKLSRWFWSTTLTEYFRGMTRSVFERARYHLHDVVRGAAGPSPPDLARIVDPIGRFDFRSARSRAVGLLLAELGPVDPVTRLASDSFEVLAQYGVDALSKLFMEREVLGASGPENRFLVPPKHSHRLRVLRDGPGSELDEQAFASHAIDGAAIEALRRQQWDEFLELRRAAIENLERARAEECGLEYRAGG